MFKMVAKLGTRDGSRGRVQGMRTPPEMTCGFLINTVQSASQLYKICFIIWYVFSAVHIMLLPSRKPSSSYSLLKFVYVTSQLRHSLVVHPLLRKIPDPPLGTTLCSIQEWVFLPSNLQNSTVKTTYTETKLQQSLGIYMLLLRKRFLRFHLLTQ